MLLLLLLLPADILLTCSCQPCCWPGPLCSAAGLAPSALLAGLADAVMPQASARAESTCCSISVVWAKH